jgi:hypothetical protein
MQPDLSIRELMQDAGGDGGILRLAQRKLENLDTSKLTVEWRMAMSGSAAE